MAIPIGGILKVGAALGGAYLAFKGRKDANKANKELAQDQMNFQEKMSGTAYQRAVEDMKLAGINPMLAYSQGGATSPGGQTARAEDVMGPAVSSAMQIERFKKEQRLIDTQIGKTSNEAYAAAAQGNLLDSQNNILTFGPKGGPSFAVQLKQQELILKRAQSTALRFSPFMSRFVGTENLRLRRLAPHLGITNRPQGRAGVR